MMLTDDDYGQFENLFAEERQFFESQRENIERLDEVLTGQITFHAVVAGWEEIYDEVTSLLVSSPGYRIVLSSTEESLMDNLEFLATTMEVLSGSQPGDLGYSKTTFHLIFSDWYFMTKHMPREARDADFKARAFFTRMKESAAGVDEAVGRCYAPEIFLNDKERFDVILGEMEADNQEYTLMKALESLDMRYDAVKEYWGGLDEEIIDDILSGEWEVLQEIRTLRDSFEKIAPTFWSDFKMYAGDHVPRSKDDYISRTRDVVETLENILGAETEGEQFLRQLSHLLRGGGFALTTIKSSLQAAFDGYVMVAEAVEESVSKAFAPLLLENCPERFKQLYDSCHYLEQDYLKSYVMKALESGVLSMSEADLEQYL